MGSAKLFHPKLNINLGLRSNLGAVNATSFLRMDLSVFPKAPLTPPITGLLADGAISGQRFAAASRSGAALLASVDAPLPA